MVNTLITHRKCRRFVFYNNMENVRAELVLFSVEKTRVTSDVVSIVYTQKDIQ